ncbi:hypothetical protein Pyn_21081 [Prunus yedoensis var. nudiflora]|uniref:Uncharacterized protein n=1 Tax=Prunus yedoensis var. nudiflora TaxID=2094558 RepID=A0A314UIK0_PRUYE|nr:hypothetical protein Pyn_21081 [Prunus yedoensis var. nudiflora]
MAFAKGLQRFDDVDVLGSGFVGFEGSWSWGMQGEREGEDENRRGGMDSVGYGFVGAGVVGSGFVGFEEW